MFAFILTLALVILAILVPITRGVVGAIRRNEQSTSGKDAQNLQEMHRRINKVEQRIEALETIIFQSNNYTRPRDTNVK